MYPRYCRENSNIDIICREKAHLVNIVQMERDTWSILDILSPSALRPDNALLGRESNPPENETFVPIVANDTMHIKCNNGPSFYPCIGCQILLLKMSLNHSFIKPAFSWHTSCGGIFIGSRVFLRWKGYDKQDLEKKNVESCFKCF